MFLLFILHLSHMDPPNKCQGGWGKRLTAIHRVCDFAHAIIDSLLCSRCPLRSFLIGHRYDMSTQCHSGVHPHTSPSDFPVPTFQACSFVSDSLHTRVQLQVICESRPYKQLNILQVLPSGRISLQHCVFKNILDWGCNADRVTAKRLMGELYTG